MLKRFRLWNDVTPAQAGVQERMMSFDGQVR
jgi:hypothetical protein